MFQKPNPNMIIAGTDDANVWITSNSGTNWTKVSATLPYRWITRVAIDPLNENISYVTFNGLKWRDPQPHIFRTTNKGQTWSDISNNLPDAPVNAFAIDPLRTNVLFAGSDVGCYYSTNTGQSWQFLGSGLPMVSVYDMKIHPTAYYLAIGTHGRSMYKIDLNTIIGINSNEQLTASDYKLEQNFPNPFNPETTIKYSVSRKSFVQIKVYDISGKLINSLVAKELSAGSYSAVWNGKDITGNNVSSGIYFYNMTINGGKSVSRKMLLIK
ncbi:MAG: T9SS type A sorting domain-containing protein [Ignavibacteria bacterium]|nr:T9SS type A sorting domain-containing protein [Ignavibacteria bacterium]